MKKIFTLLACVLVNLVVYSQTPTGFSYQAVLRDGDGKVFVNQAVQLRISLTGTTGTPVHYSEMHSLTTNGFGLVNLVIGQGDQVQGVLTQVPWDTDQVMLKLEVKVGTSGSFLDLGLQPIQAVPYALYAGNTKAIESDPAADDEEPIFVVRNKEGQIVFAVYQSGVRIYVDDTDTGKRPKGGFAVGGFSTGQGKDEEQNFLMVTPDSTRVSFKESADGGKRPKGGFAVGGFSTGQGNQSYLNVTPSHTQVSFDMDLTGKRPKGGFAVGGYSSSKVDDSEYLIISPDSARIYIDDTYTNSGGFAIGTAGSTKSSAQFIYLTPENYRIGHRAGDMLTTGRYNSFLGYEAGASVTTGIGNVFLGYKAGANTTGPAPGLTGYGSLNVFVGYLSGHSNVEGFANVFIGDRAGYENIDGTNSIFIGNSAGYSNKISSGNIFIGRDAGYNSTEYGNTIIGHSAGESMTEGSSNVFLGSYAGAERTEGVANVIVGSGASEKGGSGDYNLILGSYAGSNTVEGSRNVILGSFAGNNGIIGSNNILIGAHTKSEGLTADNMLYIRNLIFGDFSNGRLAINGETTNSRTFNVNGTAGGNSAWQTSSDARLKTNVHPLQGALAKVLKLNGVTFSWKDESNHRPGENIGFIAQELLKVLPQVVSGGGTDEEGNEIFYSVEYGTLTPILVEAIKEQQKVIEQLEEKVKEIDALKAEMDKLKELLRK